jgi:hypothetical protein
MSADATLGETASVAGWDWVQEIGGVASIAFPMRLLSTCRTSPSNTLTGFCARSLLSTITPEVLYLSFQKREHSVIKLRGTSWLRLGILFAKPKCLIRNDGDSTQLPVSLIEVLVHLRQPR